jgi:glycosyltransferase involved in cell wall biosynthesis
VASSPPARGSRESGDLRLLFVGRIHRDKGVFELPRIDRALANRGVSVAWTLIGTGPDESALRAEWPGGHVRFAGRLAHRDVLLVAAEHDVFVLPSRYEGFPLALLEAMGAGVVPVATNLESGVGETIADGINGFMRPADDVTGFADAIACLDADRPRLAAMSQRARQHVAAHHDPASCTAAYQALFARFRELKRPRPANVVLPYGTRLDRPWLPNFAVRTVRGILRRAQGREA